jgi:hypothetical protein
MKKIFATIALAVVSLASFAQTTKHGIPDMRFKSNQSLYGTAGNRDAMFPTGGSNPIMPSYSIPNPSASSYNTPTYSMPSQTPPSSTPTYTPPSTYPRSNQMFPANNNGTRDMRYNVNRYPYGR